MADGAAFMADAVEAFPYRVHAVLADDGACSTDPPRYRNGLTATFRVHVFDRARRADGIAHRLAEPCRPWTSGQAERTVRTLEEATVESLHHETRADTWSPAASASTSRDSFQAVRDGWKKEPSRFKADPHHLTAGPYTLGLHIVQGEA